LDVEEGRRNRPTQKREKIRSEINQISQILETAKLPCRSLRVYNNLKITHTSPYLQQAIAAVMKMYRFVYAHLLLFDSLDPLALSATLSGN
jgi:hypothetical protein